MNSFPSPTAGWHTPALNWVSRTTPTSSSAGVPVVVGSRSRTHSPMLFYAHADPIAHMILAVVRICQWKRKDYCSLATPKIESSPVRQYAHMFEFSSQVYVF